MAQVWNESEEGWNQELFIPYTAEYVRMHNKTSTVMRCSLSATAGTGLEITRRPAPTFDLPPHEEMTLAGEVQITSRAGVKGSEDPAHQIHTTLSIDGTVLSLRNGLEVKEPIELDCWPEYVSGYAGSTGELSITIKNNTAETAQGVLWATPPARLAVTPLKQRFEAPSEGCAGARLQLRLPQDGGNIIIDQGMEAYSGYRCLERSALPA